VAERSEGCTLADLKEAFLAAALKQAQAGLTRLEGRFAETVLAQVEEQRKHLQRSRNPDAEPIGLRRNRS